MSTAGPGVRLIVLLAISLSWVLAFATSWKRPREQAVRTDTRARWGMILQTCGFFLAFTHGPRVWASDVAIWRIAAGVVFAIPADYLLWSAIKNLGRQWRFDAGLNADHELVQSGAYRFVRHPIYASMLAMLLANICLVGTMPGWPLGIVFFIAGLEIRIRVEESLLRERFGSRFIAWQRSVPAYLPFVR